MRASGAFLIAVGIADFTGAVAVGDEIVIHAVIIRAPVLEELRGILAVRLLLIAYLLNSVICLISSKTFIHELIN